MDSTYPFFPIFAFLGFFLSLIPLPWHLQAWNSGTCFYMMWASLACLNQFVNSIVWHGNVLNPAPVWCDISIRIIMGASVGLPASSLCIQRRLYRITSIRAVSITPQEKRRDILIDSAICVLFPLVFVALQYVVQGHRFNIMEDIGCYPALYNTPLTYVLSGMWPVIIGLISAVYCVLSLRSFLRRRTEFSQFMSSNRSLTVGRYFRLMALAATEVIFTTPQAIFMMWLNATATPVGPWVSWADTHFAFSRVEEIPAVIWQENHLLALAFELSRWVIVVCALVFFVFFGFADEAKKNYRKVFWWLANLFGYRERSATATALSPRVISIGHYNPKVPPISYAVPSLRSYSSHPSSSIFSCDTKGSKSSARFLTITTDGTPTGPNSHSLQVDAWPLILHPEQTLSETHTHDPISKPPIAGSIV